MTDMWLRCFIAEARAAQAFVARIEDRSHVFAVVPPGPGLTPGEKCPTCGRKPPMTAAQRTAKRIG